jgi:hypothetical protein
VGDPDDHRLTARLRRAPGLDGVVENRGAGERRLHGFLVPESVVITG